MARFKWIPPSERGTDGKNWIEVDEIMTDPNAGLNGPVWCPEQGYFDPVLNQRFETKGEKREYMRAKGLKMDSSNSPRKIAGQGRKTLYFFK